MKLRTTVASARPGALLGVGWPGRRIEVFGVEDDCLQVTWPSLPGRRVTFEVGGRSFEVDSTRHDWYRGPSLRRLRSDQGGPGSLVVGGLEASTDYDVVLSGPGIARHRVATARTLDAPPGRLLTRLATISDMHIGERRVGVLGTLRDPRPRPDGLEPYPVRCATAAIAEAEAWGAEMIVAKGDLTREAEFDETEEVARILSSSTVPVAALLGNHDVRGPAEPVAVLQGYGVSAGREARYVDLPGVRLVIGHSPVPGLHGGRLDADHSGELVRMAGEAAGPVIVVLHHPPRRRRLPTSYPPAISWPDSRRLIEGLSATGNRVLVLAGHTHRNRRYRIRGIDVAEVGSTKDYPGGWAGYAIHERGVRQVVRRTSRPDVIAWTESTSRALGGVWGWWSPGTLADRCWTIDWS